MTRPTARVIHGDALDLMPDRMDAVFTSLPDAAETGQPMEVWESWFAEAAVRTIAATDPHGVAVFYQTDRRHKGAITSKASLIVEAAREAGARVLWHKVAVATEGVSLFRPSYTHLIAVSAALSAGRPTPDVFRKGSTLYPNATDSAALAVGMDLIERRTPGAHVFDPFCGMGSIAHAAAVRGYQTTSIDIDRDQVEKAAAVIADVADVIITKEN